MPRFSDLVDRAMEDPDRSGMRPVIEKEILHYDILFSLEKERLLNGLVFQGGTCLRLCHGAPRFSEDLDFVGGADFANAQLQEIRDCVMDHIGERYGLEVAVKDPRTMREEPTYQGLHVDRWQVSVRTAPDRQDLPSQKIKLEVANVPGHTRDLRALDLNYPFLPDSYQDLLIPCETLDEILADKVVALCACRNYVRYRDIWDMRWLDQNGAKVDGDLIIRKIEDYRSDRFREDLDAMIGQVREISSSDIFRGEMGRFIPLSVKERTLDRPGFDTFLSNRVSDLLITARSAVYGPAPHPDEEPFRI